jgi:hypothetical protein
VTCWTTAKASWTVFPFDTRVTMHVISALQMKCITLEEWQRLPKIRKHIGQIGTNMSNLWDWTLIYRGCSTRPKCMYSLGLPHESNTDTTAGGSKSRLEQSLALSRPIDRRSRWPVAQTQPKIMGSDKLLPRLSQIYDGWRKEDPPTTKQLPVEANIPKLLAACGRDENASELERAIGDLSLIAFYYLLRIGEYTIKGKRKETKQTVQFKYKDVTFFKKNLAGNLRCLPRTAPAHLIATADGATMKLDNQENGWKGVCVYQEANGEDHLCPVKALGQRFLHIQQHGGTVKTFLSAYWAKDIRADVMAEHISKKALKSAATELHYPTNKGIPITRINTHSLQSGGANALALPGYSDTQIQKMGHWRGATFTRWMVILSMSL